MILFVNENGEIQDVNTTEKSGLTTLVISDEDNPFDGWSTAKICCYRVEVADERVVMFTPYIDTRIVEQLDRQGEVSESLSGELTNAQMALVDSFMQTEELNAEMKDGLDQITQTQMAIVEIYDLLTGGM